MTGSDWALVIGAATALMAGLGRGFAWLMDRMSQQSKETIAELRTDRDYWRNRALGESASKQEEPS